MEIIKVPPLLVLPKPPASQVAPQHSPSDGVITNGDKPQDASQTIK